MILDGIRVLDFTQYLAGPTVTRLMAEMGAEIIKIEQAPSGDPARFLPIVKQGRSGYFVQQNRGKRSLCLDLAKPESGGVVRDLVAQVDVVVENFGPGVMEKRGLAYPALRALNPRVIMASVSAFGRESPLSHKTGYDWIAQAFAGVMHMTGPKDGPPQPVGIALADVSAGVHAFAAIGYALYYRERTGEGQWLDISMIDTLFHMHEINLQAYGLTGGEFKPHRMGSHHELVCPAGVFRGPSGYLVIMALQPQWPKLCRAMGRPDLETDPRFADASVRARNQAELIPLIEAWLGSFPDNDAVFARFEEFRIPSAPVLSPIDALQHEYFTVRGTVRTARDPVLGEVTIPGFPLRFSAQPALPDLVAPALGEHNAEVLAEIAGYPAAQIEALARAGVLVSGE